MPQWTTQLINENLDLYISDKNLEKKILEGNTTELENFLPKLLDDSYTFGEFIYAYIFKNFLTPDDFYEIIKEQFEKNGLKGKGSLAREGAKGSSMKLKDTKDFLKNPATKASRKLAYLYAFGLGMKEEDLAYIMNKGLQQPAVNLRDPEEAIWYWVLINDQIKNKPEKIYELTAFYETISETVKTTTYNISNKYTNELIFTFKNKIKSENDLKVYLTELKQRELSLLRAKQLKLIKENLKKLKWKNLQIIRLTLKQPVSEQMTPKQHNVKVKVSTQHSFTIRREYKENLSNMPREEHDDPNIPQTDFTTQKMDTLHSESLSSAKIEKNLISQSKKAYEKYKNSKCLLEKNIILRLFENIAWQEGTLEARFNGRTQITRNELILSYFLLEMPDIADNNLRAHFQEDSSYLRYRNIKKVMNNYLVDCRMMPLYSGNAFELFLLICMFHEDPYSYLLANWYIHLYEQSKEKYPDKLRTCLSYFPSIDRTDESAEGLEKVLKYLQKKNSKKNFTDNFRNLRSYRDILYPDPSIEAYESDYQWLLAIYETLQMISAIKKMDKQLSNLIKKEMVQLSDYTVPKKTAMESTSQKFCRNFQKMQHIRNNLSSLSYTEESKIYPCWLSSICKKFGTSLYQYEADYQKLAETYTFYAKFLI